MARYTGAGDICRYISGSSSVDLEKE